MSQAFVTTNAKYYRWHKINKRKSLKPVDKLAESLPEGDIWIVPKKLGQSQGGGAGFEEAEKEIKRMYKKRIRSTYQVSYCKRDLKDDEKQQDESTEEGPSENALLHSGDVLYGPKTQKILPPLPGARRLYGYMRPSRMYLPLTTYQGCHGKVAYTILRNEFLGIKDDEETNQEETKKDVTKTEKLLNSVFKGISDEHPKRCTCCTCRSVKQKKP